jgi:hypothetical protein
MRPQPLMLEHDPRGGSNDHKGRIAGEVRSDTGWSGRELAFASDTRLA